MGLFAKSDNAEERPAVSGAPTKRPLTALVQTIQDGRFLRGVFLAMLALSVGTVGYDFQQMIANAPGALPGSQRLAPAPMDLPAPGDQTRTYLPKTTPVGPRRGKPVLPGYFGPLDGSEIGAPMSFHATGDGRLSAVGTITPGTAARLKAFLSKRPKEFGEIFLHSPGGSVSDALAMARMKATWKDGSCYPGLSNPIFTARWVRRQPPD